MINNDNYKIQRVLIKKNEPQLIILVVAHYIIIAEYVVYPSLLYFSAYRKQQLLAFQIYQE